MRLFLTTNGYGSSAPWGADVVRVRDASMVHGVKAPISLTREADT